MISNGIQICRLQQLKSFYKWYLRKYSGYPVYKEPDEASCFTSETTCLHDLCYVGTIKQQPKIIIVGAGVAGLSAAQRLLQCGLHDFIILDGCCRAGGRVHTCELGGCQIDLGAQWIYGGTIGNPIFNMATQECLLNHPIERPNPYRGIFFTSDGIAIRNCITKKARQIFAKIKNFAFNQDNKSLTAVDPKIALWEFFTRNINEEFHNLSAVEQEFAMKIVLGLTNDLKARFGVDLSEIPLGTLRHYKEIPGGDIPIPKGYKNILNPILASLPQKSLRLNKQVKTIRWETGGSPRVEVITSDGCLCQGDYVIVTVSLGVLKESHSRIFSPPLPAYKINAIEQLGFGHINKAYFRYEKPFWLAKEAYFRPSWNFDEISQRCHWVHAIGLVEDIPNCENIITFTIGGIEAMYLEKDCDPNIINTLTRVFHKFTGDSSLPAPIEMVKSKWSYDKMFLGASSYLCDSHSIKYISDLASPLPDVCLNAAQSLYIAGEATSLGYQGTVHGARLSGIREADRIIKHTQRFRGPPPEAKSASCVQCVY